MMTALEKNEISGGSSKTLRGPVREGDDHKVYIRGVQRSIERQDESTHELNEKLRAKESRREDGDAQKSRGQIDKPERELQGAREMDNANMDHPHDDMPDLDWYYGPGYFVDDVKGGALDKMSCIEARELEMQFFKKMGVYRKMHRKDLPSGAKVKPRNGLIPTRAQRRCRIIGRG